MSKEKKSLIKSIRSNPWIISTAVLVIVLAIFLFTGAGSCTGKAISKEVASSNLVSYFEGNGVSGLEVKSVEDMDSMYLIVLTYQSQDVPFYVTKDGYIIGNSLVSILPDLEEVPSPSGSASEVSKSDVPETGLFIWSYCPYGVTALGPYSEVAKLLGDNADFKVYLYYAGHGKFEEQQNKIQACMQDLGYTSEYWNYAQEFVDTIYPTCSGDIDCDLEKSKELMDSLNIDSTSVLNCVESKGAELLAEDYNVANSLGVTGSPTLVVNGVKMSVSRNAESFKQAICESFNNAPEICGTTLDSTGTTASGNC